MLECFLLILILSPLNCLLLEFVLLGPDFSLCSMWQEEGEREILNVKEEPW